MGSMAQTGLLLVPSDALGHTWALPGVLGAGQGLPPESGPGNLKSIFQRNLKTVTTHPPQSVGVYDSVSCELVCVCVSLVRVVIICLASTHTALVSSPSLTVLHLEHLSTG